MSLLAAIPDGATVTVDSAPIIYVLDGRSKLADQFHELFAAVETGRNRIVISTITIAEVLAGPFRQRREALASRYRRVLTESRGWYVMDVDAEVAEAAARLRARHRLKLPDAIQLATALQSGSAALVTHDRDFRSVRDLPILTGQ